MASTVVRTDDLSGDTLPEVTPSTTITITDPRWDHANGESVTLDLSDTSFKALVKALDRFYAKGAPITSPTTGKAATDAQEAKAARAWAIAQRPDLKVSDRGAVPQRAIDAYRAFLNGEHASEEAINAAITAGENSK